MSPNSPYEKRLDTKDVERTTISGGDPVGQHVILPSRLRAGHLILGWLGKYKNLKKVCFFRGCDGVGGWVGKFFQWGGGGYSLVRE